MAWAWRPATGRTDMINPPMSISQLFSNRVCRELVQVRYDVDVFVFIWLVCKASKRCMMF